MRTAVVVIGLVLVAAGCSEPDRTEVGVAPTAPTPTSATTATTVPGSVVVVTQPSGLPDEPPLDTGGPAGSGCSPGGDTFPDGWWFGTVAAADAGSIGLDLACFFVGPAAQAAATEDGTSLDGDVYIRNTNPAVRTTPVAGDVTALCLAGSGADVLPCSADQLDGNVWLRVVDGRVDRAIEQFLP